MPNDREPDPNARYHCCKRLGPDGQKCLALVIGVPSVTKPDDPNADSRDGPVLIEGSYDDFWGKVNKAGFVWIEANYKRCWRYRPDIAARIREGG